MSEQVSYKLFYVVILFINETFHLRFSEITIKFCNMKKIRVLGIAPYEGMKTLMMNIVNEFPAIELTTHIGDLDSGLAIAEENFHDNFDMVISRGATGVLLQSSLALPVINVEISIFDMLCSLKLVDPSKNKIAVVSYADLKDIIRQISRLYSYDINCYTIPSANEAENVLKKCKSNGYEVFLCDMIADKTARRLGMDSYLITSGEESIRNAFREVLKISNIEKSLRTENTLLRKLFESQIGKTVVFDSNKRIFLSSIEELDSSVLMMLEDEIPETTQDIDTKVVRIRKGIIYSIRVKSINIGEAKFTAFFYSERKYPLQSEKTGISYLSSADAEKSYYGNLFCLAGTSGFSRQLSKIKYTKTPIFIYGEKGTGKEALAEYIYLNSDMNNKPLVKIDCALLNDKSWDFLVEHNASPLAELDQTLFFSNIEKLPAHRLSVLIPLLNDINANERNRIIISTVSDNDMNYSPTVAVLADNLSALSIKTIPLRNQAEQIPLLFNKALSLLNIELPHNLTGITPDAMDILQIYQWPGNLPQFQRVIKDIAVNSVGTTADKTTVEKAMQKEENSLNIKSKRGTDLSINLNDKLRDIERAIAIKVLDEENGNRTIAAKRLGISRTTLWRLVEKNQ